MAAFPIRLFIQVAGTHRAVPDNIRGLYLGSDEKRVSQAAQRGDTFAAIHVKNMDTPIGFTLQRTHIDGWNIFADAEIEGTFVDAEGTERMLVAPQQGASGFLSGVHHLTVGMNLLIIGTEEIRLFVPPQDAILEGGVTTIIAQEQKQPSWHPETRRRRQEAAGEARRVAQAETQEALTRQLIQTIKEAGHLTTADAVDAHNLTALRAKSRDLAKKNVLLKGLRSVDTTTETAYVHPLTGAIITFAPQGTVPNQWLAMMAQANFTYEHPNFRPVSFQVLNADTVEMKPEAQQALSRLPSLWESR